MCRVAKPQPCQSMTRWNTPWFEEQHWSQQTEDNKDVGAYHSLLANTQYSLKRPTAGVTQMGQTPDQAASPRFAAHALGHPRVGWLFVRRSLRVVCGSVVSRTLQTGSSLGISSAGAGVDVRHTRDALRTTTGSGPQCAATIHHEDAWYGCSRAAFFGLGQINLAQTHTRDPPHVGTRKGVAAAATIAAEMWRRWHKIGITLTAARSGHKKRRLQAARRSSTATPHTAGSPRAHPPRTENVALGGNARVDDALAVRGAVLERAALQRPRRQHDRGPHREVSVEARAHRHLRAARARNDAHAPGLRRGTTAANSAPIAVRPSSQLGGEPMQWYV